VLADLVRPTTHHRTVARHATAWEVALLELDSSLITYPEQTEVTLFGTSHLFPRHAVRVSGSVTRTSQSWSSDRASRHLPAARA